ncbi:hypothetical protein QBC38DRAFT_531843 [Podospora fimiseda]|uniref:Uncharacterized protein n=1 Tax=Podospora fimiseda TaxID=252190 RepID=A0AAN7GUA3_9PEZI|nr:hypothetical protein QBC38DRAFT_531843 [Podospora fimiseda]
MNKSTVNFTNFSQIPPVILRTGNNTAPLAWVKTQANLRSKFPEDPTEHKPAMRLGPFLHDLATPPQHYRPCRNLHFAACYAAGSLLSDAGFMIWGPHATRQKRVFRERDRREREREEEREKENEMRGRAPITYLSRGTRPGHHLPFCSRAARTHGPNQEKDPKRMHRLVFLLSRWVCACAAPCPPVAKENISGRFSCVEGSEILALIISMRWMRQGPQRRSVQIHEARRAIDNEENHLYPFSNQKKKKEEKTAWENVTLQFSRITGPK